MITEKPVTFGRSGGLLGIVCGPMNSVSALPTAIFINAGIIHRVGPNRLYVNLARAMARAGVRSLRFDLAGIGDSATPRDERGSTDDIVFRDIADAIDLASSDNPTGVVLIGLCSGADYGFNAAAADPRVRAAVLVDPNVHLTTGFYVRHWWRAARSSKTWRLLLTGEHPLARRLARLSGVRPRERTPFLAPTSLPERETMRAQLDGLLSRGCRLFYVFTGGLPYRYNHERQFETSFPGLRDGGRLSLEYHPDWDHTLGGPDAQDKLADSLVGWYTRTFGGADITTARAG